MYDRQTERPSTRVTFSTLSFGRRFRGEHLSASAWRLSWLRVVRTMGGAIWDLVRESFREVLEFPKMGSGREPWSSVTLLQGSILSDSWNRHEEKAEWGLLSDGFSILSELGAVGLGGYPSGSCENRTAKEPAEMTSGHSTGKKKATTLERGDVCSLDPSEVSLPPVGSVPVAVVYLSSTGAPYLSDVEKYMMKNDGEVEWDRYHKIKPFSSPELQSKKVRLRLALRLWQSGMLAFVTMINEVVSVFTVVNNILNG